LNLTIILAGKEDSYRRRSRNILQQLCWYLKLASSKLGNIAGESIIVCAWKLNNVVIEKASSGPLWLKLCLEELIK